MKQQNPAHPLYARGQRLSDADIVRLYAELKDSEIVGMKAGVSGTTVLNRVRAAGGEVYPPGHTRGKAKVCLKITENEVCRQYISGVSGPRLAEMAGCSVRHIYNVLDAAGIPRRSRDEAFRKVYEQQSKDRRQRRGS